MVHASNRKIEVSDLKWYFKNYQLMGIKRVNKQQSMPVKQQKNAISSARRVGSTGAAKVAKR